MINRISPIKIYNQIPFNGFSYCVCKPFEEEPYEEKEKGKSKLYPELFFIRMENYHSDYFWANQMIDATKDISKMIENNKDFDDILRKTEDYIKDINKDRFQNYKFGSKRENMHVFYLRNEGRGREYYERYNERIGPEYNHYNVAYKNHPRYEVKPIEEYRKADRCEILRFTDEESYEDYFYIGHEKPYMGLQNLRFVEQEYKKLKAIENPTVDDINKSCAIIQWLIAQGCPYERGSDSVANLLTKSIYYAYGISLSPIKEGVSLDFEAFYRNMDEYIKEYPNFFEEKPHKITD